MISYISTNPNVPEGSSSMSGSLAHSGYTGSIIEGSDVLQPGTTRDTPEIECVGLTCCNEGECTAWDLGPSQ